jgi:selenoprotein W-related protein
LTAKLLSQYKQQIKQMRLIPASGGCFELKANGELLYSKLATGKFPDEGAILDMVGSRLRGVAK